ncbi:MAG: type 1 glutamine amidotransferase [Sciscionella sp.]
MDRARILLVQPSSAGPPGPLVEWLDEAEVDVEVIRPSKQELPATLDGFGGMICLGGGMNAYDDDVHPWLAGTRALLSSAVTAQLPVLAICLGAQLLAVATGGQVRQMPDGPEAGPLLVAKRDVAADDVLFHDVPFMPDVLQFHSDEVSALPPGAQLLASSPRCVNQAFRVGNCGYGVQFHIETTPAIVSQWAASSPQVAATVRDGDLTPERLADVHCELAEAWRPFVTRFGKLVRGELAPVPGSANQLPLV